MTNKKDKEQLEKEELGNINGGGFSPTWIPVDEICKEINKGTTCGDPGMKGHCGNCHDCIHNS